MGVDIGDAHWAYSGFNRFRTRLAEAEGFVLSEMFGFHGERSWDAVTTTLKPLLNHSDCDGELSPDECLQVIPRLSEILDEWDDPDLYDFDVQKGRTLLEAMQDSVDSGDPLVFW